MQTGKTVAFILLRPSTAWVPAVDFPTWNLIFKQKRNERCAQQHIHTNKYFQAQLRGDVQALPLYYLYGDGDLKAALAKDGLVDVDKVGLVE